MMKKIDSGHGNYGDLMNALEKARKEEFRYTIVATNGSRSGLMGGSFSYEVLGTDDMKELLTPSVLRQKSEIYDTKANKLIEKAQLAKLYLQSLTAIEKAGLVDTVLESYLTNAD